VSAADQHLHVLRPNAVDCIPTSPGWWLRPPTSPLLAGSTTLSATFLLRAPCVQGQLNLAAYYNGKPCAPQQPGGGGSKQLILCLVRMQRSQGAAVIRSAAATGCRKHLSDGLPAVRPGLTMSKDVTFLSCVMHFFACETQPARVLFQVPCNPHSGQNQCRCHLASKVLAFSCVALHLFWVVHLAVEPVAFIWGRHQTWLSEGRPGSVLSMVTMSSALQKGGNTVAAVEHHPCTQSHPRTAAGGHSTGGVMWAVATSIPGIASLSLTISF